MADSGSGGKLSRGSRSGGFGTKSSSPVVHLAPFSSSYSSPSKVGSPSKWQSQQAAATALSYADEEAFVLLSAKLGKRFSLSAQKQRRPKVKTDYSISEAVAEMEAKESLLVSAITTQTQRLDATRKSVLVPSAP